MFKKRVTGLSITPTEAQLKQLEFVKRPQEEQKELALKAAQAKANKLAVEIAERNDPSPTSNPTSAPTLGPSIPTIPTQPELGPSTSQAAPKADLFDQVDAAANFSYVTLSRSKFQVASSLNFAGCIVSNNGVQPDLSRISSLTDFPVPRDQTGVRSFLSLIHI